MSTLGIELSHGLQGADLQKSIMQTLLMAIGITQTRFASLGGDSDNTVELDRQTSMTKTGRVTKAILLIRSNTIGAISTITLRKNGSNSSPLLEFSIPPNNSVNQESPIIVPFNVKDLLNWQIVTLGGSGSLTLKLTIQVELEA